MSAILRPPLVVEPYKTLYLNPELTFELTFSKIRNFFMRVVGGGVRY